MVVRRSIDSRELATTGEDGRPRYVDEVRAFGGNAVGLFPLPLGVGVVTAVFLALLTQDLVDMGRLNVTQLLARHHDLVHDFDGALDLVAADPQSQVLLSELLEPCKLRFLGLE